MTPRKAPEAVLVALAEASLEVDRIAGRAAVYGGGELGNALQVLHKAQDSYRAATATLRTRAERDAELVQLLMEADEPPHAVQVPINPGLRMRLTELLREPCSEPIADETEAPTLQQFADRITPCDVCDGRGFTHECSCKFAHRCAICGGSGKR